jgi:hypothetical protein
MTDTATFLEGSELSAHGAMNAARAELVKFRKHADEGVRHRCNTLIANIDGLKRNPDDKALMIQFEKNSRDLGRYMFSIQSERGSVCICKRGDEMKEVTAYKCAYTGRIFEAEIAARRCEFEALILAIGGHMPAMGSVNPKDIMVWLSSNLQSGIYPSAADRFIEAADYLREHRDAMDPVAKRAA